MIVGGQIVMHVANAPPVVLPVVGQLYAWQTVFILVGLPGLLMALLMTTKSRDGANRWSTSAAMPIWLQRGRRFVGERCPHVRQPFLRHVDGRHSRLWLVCLGPRCSFAPGAGRIAEIGLAYGIVTLVAGPVASAVRFAC